LGEALFIPQDEVVSQKQQMLTVLNLLTLHHKSCPTTTTKKAVGIKSNRLV